MFLSICAACDRNKIKKIEIYQTTRGKWIVDQFRD